MSRSRPPGPSSSSRRGRVRSAPALLAALLVGVAVLVAVPVGAGAAPAERTVPRRWAGHEIPRTDLASGGWIGGYRVGRAPVYVTTPTRRPNRRGYRRERRLTDLGGRGGASRAETMRAAWVLSKYGGYRDATQAAAVDATTYHLLAGRRWRISGARGGRRVRQSPDSATVRRFARIMLRQSRRSAGAYRARLRATRADVGGTVAVRVRVTDGRRHPAAGLPVRLAYEGADPVRAVTGDDGRALARFPAGRAGWHDVRARVREVPDHRLHLRRPLRRGQAAAAEGGARRTLVASTRAAVRGPQALSVLASPATVTVGDPAGVVATVEGDGTRRTARATLHGPFTSPGAAECRGSAVGSVRRTVREDGDYRLAPVSVRAGGHYIWRVAVDGTATSLPVSACGAAVRAMALTTTGLTAAPTASVGDVVGADASVRGLPSGARAEVTVTLAGPYATAGGGGDDCGQNVVHRDVLTRSGDGSLVVPSVPVDAPGYYLWQARTAPGDLWKGSSSSCGADGTVTRVVR